MTEDRRIPWLTRKPTHEVAASRLPITTELLAGLTNADHPPLRLGRLCCGARRQGMTFSVLCPQKLSDNLQWGCVVNTHESNNKKVCIVSSGMRWALVLHWRFYTRKFIIFKSVALILLASLFQPWSKGWKVFPANAEKSKFQLLTFKFSFRGF